MSRRADQRAFPCGRSCGVAMLWIAVGGAPAQPTVQGNPIPPHPSEPQRGDIVVSRGWSASVTHGTGNTPSLLIRRSCGAAISWLAVGGAPAQPTDAARR